MNATNNLYTVSSVTTTYLTALKLLDEVYDILLEGLRNDYDNEEVDRIEMEDIINVHTAYQDAIFKYIKEGVIQNIACNNFEI